ncbi:MAG: six-hairpin glycosidase [Bacteroidota bacterium]|nr:six-hairpin glycosidase [Bacteroidota bacterium]
MNILKYKRDIRGNHIYLVFSLIFGLGVSLNAQETIRYTGNTLVNIDYHHGQLSPAVGVHNIQVFRANRQHPELAEGSGWTYNHAPMLAYWNNLFYLEYLSDSVSESVAPGQTLLTTSKDGYNWSKPKVIFPKYKVPEGTVKETEKDGLLTAHNLYSVMHQRMGFYVSKKNRLLILAFYGISMNERDAPNDGKGIGRVVREAFPDGHLGPIYFIHYNPAWNAKNTSYPFYTKSKDKGFVEACNELMDNPLMMQQWNEESDPKDPLIPLQKDYKAFCFYHLPDGRVVGLWKNALTSISNDNGKTWPLPVRAPKFVNANAKFWGQHTSDGKYVTVYNPSEFRWPLALSVSQDGLDYNNLLLVQGEISTMRYGGFFKNNGPQYVRGIIEGNGIPPDGNLWLTYSMNKEDIWVAEVPVPISDKVENQVNDVFNTMNPGEELKYWNIYSPLWAPVKTGTAKDGSKCLVLRDWDKFDFAKAERIFPASKKLSIEFSLETAQSNKGLLHVELQNSKGTPAIRLVFDSTGYCMAKAGYRYSRIMKYNAGQEYKFRISFDTDKRFYTVNVNGKDVHRGLFFAPVDSLERIVFRTGEPRYLPNAETPAEQMFDVPDAGEKDAESAFYIKYVRTTL